MMVIWREKKKKEKETCGNDFCVSIIKYLGPFKYTQQTTPVI